VLPSSGPGTEGDYGYDLAHEALPENPAEPDPATSSVPAPPVVVTGAEDTGGDYGYDLAHDIPGAPTTPGERRSGPR